MSSLNLIQLDGCDQCGMQRDWGRMFSPRMPIAIPKFPRDERVLILGDVPSESDDDVGTPFAGRSGNVLRSILPREWEKSVYYGNLLRCHPSPGRAPSDFDHQCCANYLRTDLTTIDPTAILLLGSEALGYFWPGANVTSYRGIPFPIQLPSGNWTWGFSTFHPKYVGESEKKDGNNSVLPIFRTDIEKFFNLIPDFCTAPSIPPPPSNILYPQSLDEVKALWQRLAPGFGNDFETFKLKPYQRDARMLTAACSDGVTTFAFPVKWLNQFHTWGVDAVIWIYNQVKAWTAHNASFELAWIWYMCDNFNQIFGDSEGLARIHHERKTTLSLEDQTRIHLGFNVKELTNVDVMNLAAYPLKEVLDYNAYDAWGSWELKKRIKLTAKQQPNYDRILESIKSTTAMELWGLPVNLEETANLKILLATRKEEYVDQAKELPVVQQFEKGQNKTFMLSAPDDVGIALVKYCGLKLPLTESKKYSTDESDLQVLVDAHPLVNITLDYREVSKLLSTYVEPLLMGALLGTDGLLHPSYTTLLTATGRLSSTDPNIQNFPKRKHREVRKQIVPPPGHILASFDYGQLEARALQMASGDLNLRKAFINHEDIHSKWLNRCLKVYPDYLNRLATKTGQKDEKAIRKYGRDIIKTDFVFASFYGSIAKSVAARTEIPYKIVEELLDEFWREYPGVKEWILRQFAFYLQYGYIETLTNLARNEILPGNEPINTAIQGTGAHVVLDAQNALFYKAFTEDIILLPRINVHDDLSFFFPDDDRMPVYASKVAYEMVKPRYSWVSCPWMVEMKVGYDWAELEDMIKWEGQYYEEGVLVDEFKRVN